MPGWLSRNNFTGSDFVHASDLNNLANDDRTWGGDVNGGGYHLSNVILQGSGGFTSYVSPIEVTPGSSGTTCLQLDQTVSGAQLARWSVCKDATAESGANAGSDFAISRYDDSGAFLGKPMAINRATGVVYLGAQQWTGPINGGGNTISNVVIPGVLADPTTTKGDILARSASALARVPVGTDGFILTASSASASGVTWAAAPATGVPTSRKILTGLGLSGGGDLTADRTIAGVVMGASGGSHAAGLVPDPGATLGATRYLREDATWGVPAGAGGGLTDPTTTLGDILVRGSAAVTRLGVGANGQVLTADSTQTLGVKWAAGGGSQTPWLTNIDGNGKTLTNVLQIGIGLTNPTVTLDVQTPGAVGCRLRNTTTASNNVQFRLYGANAAADLWALGTDMASANGSKDFSILDIAANTQVIYCQQGTGRVGIGIIPNNFTFIVHAAANTNLGIASSNGLSLQAVNDAQNTYSPMSLYATSFAFMNGSVGIGTVSPLTTLTVSAAGDTLSGSASFNAAFLQDQTTYRGVYLGYDTAGVIGVIGASSGGNPSQLAFWTYNSGWGERMRITNLGNVGIGTASPRGLLSLIPLNNPTTPATATQLMIGESSNSAGYNFTLGYYFDSGTGGYKGVLQTLAGGNGWPMLLNPVGGAVAIGSANPNTEAQNARFVVVGSPGQYASSLATSNTQASISIRSNANSGYSLAIGGESTNGFPYLQAVNYNGGSASANLVLQPWGGTIGIGKVTPAYALDVTGDVNCTGAFRVNGAALAGGGITTVTFPSRALNTVYQNPTGKPMFVSVTGSPAAFIAYSDGSNPPSAKVSQCTGAAGTTATATFWVMPGNFYQISASGVTLNQWIEWY